MHSWYTINTILYSMTTLTTHISSKTYIKKVARTILAACLACTTFFLCTPSASYATTKPTATTKTAAKTTVKKSTTTKTPAKKTVKKKTSKSTKSKKKSAKKYKNGTSRLLDSGLIDPSNPPGGL